MNFINLPAKKPDPQHIKNPSYEFDREDSLKTTPKELPKKGSPTGMNRTLRSWAKKEVYGSARPEMYISDVTDTDKKIKLEFEDSLKGSVFFSDTSQKDPALVEIENWGDLELELQQNVILPRGLAKNVDIKSWTNIPPCLVRSSESFAEGLDTVSNAYLLLLEQLKSKMITVSQQFRKVTKDAQEGASGIRKQIDQDRTQMREFLETFRSESQKLLEHNREDLEEVRENIQKDREYIFDRLVHIEDTFKTKEWAKALVAQNRAELKAELQKELDYINMDIKKIWNQNLLVPNLIGVDRNTCKYQNLQGCLKGLNERISSNKAAIAEQIDKKIQIAISELKNNQLKVIQSLKDRNDKSIRANQGSIQELSEKISALKHEIKDFKPQEVKSYSERIMSAQTRSEEQVNKLNTEVQKIEMRIDQTNQKIDVSIEKA